MRYATIMLSLGLAAVAIVVLGVGPSSAQSRSGASSFLASTSIGDLVIGSGPSGPFRLVRRGLDGGHRGVRSDLFFGRYPGVKVGDQAPDFMLPSISGDNVTLNAYRGKQNVVLSFVPAAWTPLYSEQWRGYNIAKDIFDKNDAVLIGISVDSVPTLSEWTKQTGELWFPVISDFWPHGAAAKSYGVLKADGTAERALFIIDRQGIIRYIDVHDINTMPRLEDLSKELEKLQK